MSSMNDDVEVQVQLQPEAGEREPWLPELDPSLKPERVQEPLLQQQAVREQVTALLGKMATCDRQRIRLNVTAKRAVFTVEGAPRPGMAGTLMQTALKLGQAV